MSETNTSPVTCDISGKVMPKKITERHTDKPTEKQKDRQTDRQKDRQTNIQVLQQQIVCENMNYLQVLLERINLSGALPMITDPPSTL